MFMIILLSEYTEWKSAFVEKSELRILNGNILKKETELKLNLTITSNLRAGLKGLTRFVSWHFSPRYSSPLSY